MPEPILFTKRDVSDQFAKLPVVAPISISQNLQHMQAFVRANPNDAFAMANQHFLNMTALPFGSAEGDLTIGTDSFGNMRLPDPTNCSFVLSANFRSNYIGFSGLSNDEDWRGQQIKTEVIGGFYFDPQNLRGKYHFYFRPVGGLGEYMFDIFDPNLTRIGTFLTKIINTSFWDMVGTGTFTH